MSHPLQYVLATHNAAKIAEYADIVGHYAPGWAAIAPSGAEPAETGTSFAENALIKARAAHAGAGGLCLADDSGICVDVLGGAPGIFSAYWGGRAKDPAVNRRVLLEQLADIPAPHRGAHFASALALIEPDGTEHIAEAKWHGRLAVAPAGDDGFPYDSIFVPLTPVAPPGAKLAGAGLAGGAARGGDARTVAQWDSRTRHLASHRALAFRRLVGVFAKQRSE
ncbi:non-canonical purine NTP pyrophosphatase [Leucobacter albus]|uniref:Non-canonical purine NTP pyrophosphatase n=1 Tax=Leucobacter albus TaxID=272210 RepID=A0ABW3TSH1_9MICO